jgi:type II secretion system protein I
MRNRPETSFPGKARKRRQLVCHSSFIIHHSSFPSRAFSVLEVLCALTIFSVAVVGIIEGVTLQIKSERNAEETTRAAMLAQNILEEIRQAGEYSDDSQSGKFDEENTGFQWQYDMKETDVTGLFRVSVKILWGDGAAQRDYAIETFLSER